MKTFAAIDFETANQYHSSVCSVGVVIIRDGIRVNSFYSLIQPEPNYYGYFQTRVHGLTQDDTEKAPIFPKVWAKIAPLIEGLPLVAHNKSFDESCLKSVFRTYSMDYPNYEFCCTYRITKRIFPNLPNYSLKTVSEYFGFDLKDHHNALADAEAAAHIALRLFE